MSQVKGKFKVSSDGHDLLFYCPACQQSHGFNLTWQFNGDYQCPTVRPSILVRNGHYDERHRPSDSCWCTFNAQRPDNPSSFKCFSCHSHITDGKIEYGTDCTHHMAGQTVELPAWRD